jgi:hypothetical protein
LTQPSEKEGAAATFKKGFGSHPVLAFLDNTNEADHGPGGAALDGVKLGGGGSVTSFHSGALSPE